MTSRQQECTTTVPSGQSKSSPPTTRWRACCSAGAENGAKQHRLPLVMACICEPPCFHGLLECFSLLHLLSLTTATHPRLFSAGSCHIPSQHRRGVYTPHPPPRLSRFSPVVSKTLDSVRHTGHSLPQLFSLFCILASYIGRPQCFSVCFSFGRTHEGENKLQE